MTLHQVDQNTDNPCPCCGKTWMELRSDKITGSSIGKLMANYGKAFGDPAKRLAVDIAVIQLGGEKTEDNYRSPHMDRGHEEEPIARAEYERTTFVEVSNGGFIDNGTTGCSPDGLVGTDGLIEIKCVINSVFYADIKRGRYDPKYKWQLYHNLNECAQTGRTWIDYVSYCATFPVAKRIFIDRIHISDIQDDVRKMNERVAAFCELVEDVKHKISNTQ